MKKTHPEIPDADLLADKIREVAYRLGDWPNFDDGVFYNEPDAKRAAPFIREEYIIKQIQNKRVLHFGFVDSPFTEERIKNGSLLHIKLQRITSLLWGADIDEQSVKLYNSITGDYNTWIFDVCSQIENLENYNKDFDYIVFGEILEHLKNPGDALDNLRHLCDQNKAKLILTTPNAFNSAGFVAAMLGHEIVHPEHYYYYSPSTLKRLLGDCGFKDIKISFYSGLNTSESPGLTFPGLIAECSA